MRILQSAVVSVLVEVTFPMDIPADDEVNDQAACAILAGMLETDQRRTKELLEDRVWNYGEVLRVNITP